MTIKNNNSKHRRLFKALLCCAILVVLIAGFGLSVVANAAEVDEAGSISSSISAPQNSANSPVASTGAEPASVSGATLLTIRYLSANGQEEMAPAYVAELDEGEEYTVPSPEIDGFVAAPAQVSGTMPAQSETITVTYTLAEAPANSAEESSSAPSPQAPSSTKPSTQMEAQSLAYNLTIRYLYEDSTIAEQPYIGQYFTGESYAVNSPALEGYYPNIETVNGAMAASNVTITVTYLRAQQNSYRVKHIFETLDGSYSEDPTYPAKRFEGPTGEQTNATALEVEGFTAQPITQAAIAADGSTVIVIRYNRVVNYLYYLTGGDYIDPVELKYGQSITLPTTPTRAGYTFTGWFSNAGRTTPYPSSTFTMGASEYTLYAGWQAATSPFTLALWIENPNAEGEYDFYQSLLSSGQTGELSSIGEADAPGWAWAEFSHADNVIIKADGSSIVNMYVNRKTYELNFYRGLGWDSWNPNVWVNSIESTPYYTIRAKAGADVSSDWLNAGDEFFKFRWTVKNTDPWGNWTTGFNTMPYASYNYYGVPISSGHTYYIHYMYEIYDQSSDDYTRIWNGKKYDEELSLRQRFTYTDGSAYLTDSPPSYSIPGFAFTGKDQFAVTEGTEHAGYYYYNRQSFKVEFNTMGGSAAPATIQEPYMTPITAPANPTKTGYTFAGWYNNQALVGEPFNFETVPSKNTILYAKWEPEEYTVSFKMNNGTPAEHDSQTVIYEQSAQMPASPQRPGYVFLGWYTNTNAVGSRFVFDKIIKADTVLYAGWALDSIVPYTVKYTKLGGGEYAPSKAESGYNGQTFTEQAYIDNDQKYVPDFASKSIVLDAQAGQNVLEFVYRPFTTLSYRVEHRYANNHELISAQVAGTANPQTVTNSEYARVAVSALSIPGYQADAQTKSKVLLYEVTEADIQENVIVFYYTQVGPSVAQYTVEHYIENVSAIGMQPNYQLTPYYTETQTGTPGSTATAAPITIAGHQYNADASQATRTGVIATGGSLVLKLYYNAQRYTVTFNSQGGSSVSPVQGLIAGSTVPQPRNPAHSDYLFDGWYKDAACEDPWNFNTDTISGDTTLYAKWIPLKTGNPPPAPGSSSSSRAPSRSNSSSSAVSSSSGSSSDSIAPPVLPGQTGSSSTPPPQNNSPDDAPPSDYTGALDETIQGGPVPLGGLGFRGAWSLLNLTVGVLSLLIAAVTAIGLVTHHKKALPKNTGTDEENTTQSRGLTGMFAVLCGLLPLVLFIILENLKLPMVLINRWSLLIGSLFFLQMVVLTIYRLLKKKSSSSLRKQLSSQGNL